MNEKVIDNFLPNPVFEYLLQIILSPSFKWTFTSSITDERTEKIRNKLFLLNHVVYEKQVYESPDPIDAEIIRLLNAEHIYYSKFKNYFDVLGLDIPKGQFFKIPIEKLLRIKVNFYPNTTVLQEHDYHKDFDYPHNGCLLSLNTCDGYTKIRETGNKYHSVANRLLYLDSSKDHCSTTTTNAIGRFNINVNYQNE